MKFKKAFRAIGKFFGACAAKVAPANPWIGALLGVISLTMQLAEEDKKRKSVINANKEIFPIKWRENYEFNAYPPKPNI